MLSSTGEPMCLHCERRPRSSDPRYRKLRLCDHCASIRGWRIVYRRRSGWTPAHDRRIQELVERAKAKLPLFEEPTPGG
jgi:hypothetical protein